MNPLPDVLAVNRAVMSAAPLDGRPKRSALASQDPGDGMWSDGSAFVCFLPRSRIHVGHFPHRWRALLCVAHEEKRHGGASCRLLRSFSHGKALGSLTLVIVGNS